MATTDADRWKWIAGCLAAVLLTAGGMWWSSGFSVNAAIRAHENKPIHSGSVPRETFDLTLRQVNDKLSEINERLKSFQEKFDQHARQHP